MNSVACGKAAGFDAELLESVWKWERQINAGKRIVVIAAVQQVICVGPLSTGDGDRDGTLVALTASEVACVADGSGGAGEEDELSSLATVQRKLGDAPFVYDLRNGVLLGLDHVDAGVDLNILSDGA